MIALALASVLLADQVGLEVGKSVAPFEPFHVTGPYAGGQQCPVCEWGGLPLVFIWTNGADTQRVKPVVDAVNRTIGELGPAKFRAFVIDANLKGDDETTRIAITESAKACDAGNVYFMFRTANLTAVLENYRLGANPNWKINVITVKNRAVTATWVDPNSEAIPDITAAIGNLLAP